MKIKFLSVFVFAFACNFKIQAQTSVSGTLTQNAEWTLSGSPYTLTGTLGIPSGVTLTIDAGVQVNGNYDLLVKGTILINGTTGQPVSFQNTRLLFKSTDLSMSTVQNINFNQAGVQLADESEFSQDSPKNSNTLAVLNCSFSNGSYARSKGYQTTAKLHLENCSIVNSTVYGYYPRSEPIEINNSSISSSTITSDSYNYGIIISNTSVSATSFALGCCGANFNISNSQIDGSNFTTFNNYSSISISGSTLTETYINIPGANLTMSQTTMSATSIPQPFLIAADYCNISSSTLKGYSGISLVKVNSLSGNDTFHRVNFQSFNVGIEIDNFTFIKIDSCNFIGGSSYSVSNQSNKNVNAQSNYWGTTDDPTIQSMIYDLYDNINSGVVDYSNFRSAPIVTNPLPRPTGVFKGMQTNGNLISWTKVNSPSVIGYKVYKKTGPTTFQLLIDAGNSSSMITSESFASDFAVTSYDASADGTNDLLEGHESDFSPVAQPFFQVNNTNDIPACQKSLIYTNFTKNFSFGNSSHFDLYVSHSKDDFSNAALVVSVNSDSSSIKWSIPDSVVAGHNLYFRIQSSQLSVFSEVVKVIVNPTPFTDFSFSAQACPLGSYQLLFSGTTNPSLSLQWGLDGGTLLTNDSNTKLTVTWPTPGTKNILLAGTQSGCTGWTSKAVSVSTPPVLAVPTIKSISWDESSRRNSIAWISDSTLTKKINIYRESSIGQFDLLNTVDYLSKFYLDLTSQPEQQATRYKISATDVCGAETDLSVVVRTVLLQISQGGGSWNLNWEKRDESGIEMLVYRKHNTDDWQNIGRVSSTSTAYTDVNVPTGSLWYQLSLTVGPTQIKSNVAWNGITAVTGQDAEVRVYPNPVTDRINFQANGPGQYELLDLMNNTFANGLARVGENEIPASSLPSGLYVLKLTMGNSVKAIKVVKN